MVEESCFVVLLHNSQFLYVIYLNAPINMIFILSLVNLIGLSNVWMKTEIMEMDGDKDSDEDKKREREKEKE